MGSKQMHTAEEVEPRNDSWIPSNFAPFAVRLGSSFILVTDETIVVWAFLGPGMRARFCFLLTY